MSLVVEHSTRTTFDSTCLSLVGNMPQKVSCQKSELDGEHHDDDGGYDIEGDGAAAQRIVKVLHGRVRVREAGAGQVIDLGRHLQTLSFSHA